VRHQCGRSHASRFPAADLALRTVARTLLESSRGGDNIARFGGEEFALTITDVDEASLRAIAERFRVLVERSRVTANGQDLQVTISIGGAIAEVGDTAETLFERADAALYRAKEGGRNRVVLAGDPGASAR
jgi:diguanylate cyclase